MADTTHTDLMETHRKHMIGSRIAERADRARESWNGEIIETHAKRTYEVLADMYAPVIAGKSVCRTANERASFIAAHRAAYTDWLIGMVQSFTEHMDLATDEAFTAFIYLCAWVEHDIDVQGVVDAERAATLAKAVA